MMSIKMTIGATGAAEAASHGDVIVVVDVVNTSSAAEVALREGAVAIIGAAPDSAYRVLSGEHAAKYPFAETPEGVDPIERGREAGKIAVEEGCDVVLVVDGGEDNASLARKGVEDVGAEIREVVPNAGPRIKDVVDPAGKVFLFATATGGTLYDVAKTHGAPAVTFGTVVRRSFTRACVERALRLAGRYGTGITVVVSSIFAPEDLDAGARIFEEACKAITESVCEERFEDVVSRL
ncbi:hypothetical protein [Methanopyrus sp. KOL6]|uniref:hypothetical protein n=1 Tax=Methanopyrus sp. KOL6 TaxID=1937004 RepID=UPI000B4B4E99|nr:hypothetical protein [Methanopyrus sp. KOL6]